MGLIRGLFKFACLAALGVALFFIVSITFLKANPFDPNAPMYQQAAETWKNQTASAGQWIASRLSPSTPTTANGVVLGAQEPSLSTIPQQTAEYARYLYCQQVVSEWDKSHPTPLSSSTPTPQPSASPSPSPKL